MLELGTGTGLTTLALASALQFNGRGLLTTVDRGPDNVRRAAAVAARFGLEGLIRFVNAGSLDFIAADEGEPFDFVLFDTDIAVRHLEFDRLREKGRLAGLVAFHDTSRLRGRSMRDFNPAFIAGLDRIGREHGLPGLENPLSRGLRLFQIQPRLESRHSRHPD